MSGNDPRQNIGGNYYDKYHSRNPIARFLMRGFLSAFDEMIEVASPRSVYEVGCGEGELLARLRGRGVQVSGCDIDAPTVARARARVPQVDIEVADLASLARAQREVDLIVCCEVLEHVQDLPGSLDALDHLVADKVLFSVPREPLWRVMNMARGHYWPALGNTPGHVNHWSRGGFLRMLSARWNILATRAPVPWTMALCARRVPD